MEKQALGSITKYFEELQDPRTGNAKAHIFPEILIIAICAVICGADGWSDVELFGKTKKDWQKRFWNCRKAFPLTIHLGVCLQKSNQENFKSVLLNRYKRSKS